MGYHELTLNPAVSRKFLTALEENDPPLPLEDGDFLVARGMSGLHRGTLVSLAWGLPLYVLRKPTDTDHHDSFAKVRGCMWLDGKAPPQEGRAIFVDDFIASGATLAVVKDVVPIWGIVLLGSWSVVDRCKESRVDWAVIIDESGSYGVDVRSDPLEPEESNVEMDTHPAADPEGTDVLQGDPEAPL